MGYLIRTVACSLLLGIFCSRCFCIDNSTEHRSPKGNETWIAVEKGLRQLVGRLFKDYLPVVMRMRSEVELSNECSSGLMQFVFSLRQLKLWALKMIDASAKPAPGIFMGALAALGSYEECVNIESDGRRPVYGQYCTVDILPLLPPKPDYIPLWNHDIITKNNSPKISLATRLESINSFFYIAKAKLGLCIPSTCNETELEAILAIAVRSYSLQLNVSSCQVKKGVEFSNEQIAVIAVVTSIATLVVLATLLEIMWYLKNGSFKKGNVQKIVIAFSLHSSVKKLFAESRVKALSPLHGIHFLTILWIIVGITYKTYEPQYINHLFHLEEESNKPLFQTIQSSRTAYNTLYFLSGILTAYFALKNKEERRFNSFMFVLLRYLRLTAVLLFSLGFIILTPLLSSGPMWEDIVTNGVSSCQNSWWTYILYITNWGKFENMCTFAFEYASSVFQLHILSLVVVTLLYSFVNIGILLLLALTASSIIAIAIFSYEYRLFPTTTKFTEPGFQSLLFEKISLQPYGHLGPYGVGLFIGYLIARHSKLSLKARYQACAWIFSTCVGLAVVYYPYISHHRDEPIIAESTILSSIYRTGWSLAIGWIVFACATGHGGVINHILSCPLFIPLSRLGFLGFFLLEYIIRIRYGTMEQLFTYSHYNMAYEVFGHFLMIMFLSFVGYLLVDAPVSNLLEQLISISSAQKADLKEDVKVHPQKVQLKTIFTHSGE